jgi:hypothetical protein
LWSEIDALHKQVELIQERCFRYYGMPGKSQEALNLARDIRLKIKQAATRTSRLNLRLPESGAMSNFVRFRQAATIELDDQSRSPLANDDPLFDKIAESGMNLIKAIRDTFEVRFK